MALLGRVRLIRTAIAQKQPQTAITVELCLFAAPIERRATTRGNGCARYTSSGLRGEIPAVSAQQK
jgi:hypothetical protein